MKHFESGSEEHPGGVGLEGCTASAPRPPERPSAKHIVVIPSWYSSGRGSGGGYFRDQALALHSVGHRVVLLAPDIHTMRDLRAGRVEPTSATRLLIEDHGIPVYRRSRLVLIPRLPYRNAVAWSLGGLALFTEYIAKHGRPDLVHAHSCLNAGVLAALIKARFGIPFAVTEHSTAFDQGRLRWWERDLVRRVARRADRRIAVSPHLARLLETRFTDSSWIYIPNILGPAFLQPSAGRPAAATDRPFVFLCAARLWPEKNHALLIAAFADAFAGDRGVRLQLAGGGPLREELQRFSLEQGIAGQVDFLGDLPADGLRAAMDAADAFVLASDVESFGVVVIEAQAAGLPVVCTASGGPDHLVNDENGMLIAARDRAALRNALIEMRRRAAGYDTAAIRAAALGEFSPLAFARRFAEMVG